VTDFMRWIRSLDAVPTIRALRERADAVRDDELARARERIARGEDPRAVMERLARDLTNKLTHAPSAALKQADADGNAEFARVARRLFDLGDDS
jgi:glutamyl-tRNA reductase